MSGYLNRLIMRTQAPSEAPSMQPFVRSTSPVAERDQRIGIMGLEGFEFGESPFSTADSEAGLEETGALQTSMLPTITAETDAGKTTVQRKMASPSTPAAPSLIGVDARRKGDLQPARRSPHRDAVPPSRRSVMDERPRQAPRSPLTYPEKNVIAGEEWSISSTEATREREPIPGSPQTRSAVRTRSLQQARPADSNFLEPVPRALAEHIEQTPMDSSMSTGDASEGPRIVIGRINVEVVPPPAAPQSIAAPRPGPLTAASVSVIEPLGGGIRPNLRLSLRHR